MLVMVYLWSYLDMFILVKVKWPGQPGLSKSQSITKSQYLSPWLILSQLECYIMWTNIFLYFKCKMNIGLLLVSMHDWTPTAIETKTAMLNVDLNVILPPKCMLVSCCPFHLQLPGNNRCIALYNCIIILIEFNNNQTMLENNIYW